MKIIEQTDLNAAQKQQVFWLWNDEYPETLSYQTLEQFDDYLKGLQERQHFLLIDEQAVIHGWAITFAREEEQWFAIILDSLIHGKGCGSSMLEQLKLKHEILNGWVIDHPRDRKTNGQPYRSPLGFYLKNGFEIISGTRLELDFISAVKIIWQQH